MTDHGELYRLLPHRHPVLLVDRIVDGETIGAGPGSWLSAIKAVSGSEPCYAGLGPDAPRSAFAYPTALLLESFIQSAAALWARTSATLGRTHEGTLVLGAARQVAVQGTAHPGDTVQHRPRLERVSAGTAFATGTSVLADRPDQTLLTIGSLVLALRPLAPARALPGLAKVSQ
ncbi:3-hydroxyacyl-ACP dehydratase FabZ family protein [Salinispora oceanensis]|uniref:3-hydroxyacyl-ACP dehydratase FabZ family protein n=1 Tax=Salinispora oceanensis TaxID=1050199 RepID=UPI00036EB251|nr:hypothetical protein [Salinispora oceanensis]